MNFTWYKIFNMNAFMATGLISKVYLVVLEGIGQKDILVARGNGVSIVYEDVLLQVLFEEDNPFVREGDANTYAVYQDTNADVWLGVLAQ